MRIRLLASSLIFLLITAITVSQEPFLDLGNSRQPVNMLFFTPDSRYLVSGGFLKISSSSDGNILFNSSGKNGEVASELVLFSDISKDGRYIAMVKVGGRLEVFDLTTRTTVSSVRNPKIRGVAFSPDNKTVAYILSGGTLVFANRSDCKRISEFKVRDAGILTGVEWSGDGRSIVIGGRGSNALLYDTEKKDIISICPTGGREVTDIAFSPDSRYFALALKEGIIRLYNRDTGGEVLFWNAHQGDVQALAFHPSGRFLASGGSDKFIRIWDIPSGTPVSSWEAHKKEVASVSFSPDGLLLASGSLNTIIGGVSDTRVWKMAQTMAFNSAAANIGASGQATPREEGSAARPVEQDNDKQSTAVQRRLALIIGNGVYIYGGTLANPENDAKDIGAKLSQLGFDVMLYENVDQKGFKKAIDDFGERLASYDVGLFYYAGHGIQVRGNNYLIPVDANLKSENDVEYDCLDAGRLLSKMEDAGSTTNIVILDACRDNPFERSWRRSTRGQGLAFMTAPAGSLISYATSPGATASDGSGRNGLFTTALLNYIEEPGLPILEVFQKVRTFVRENSNGEQVPWESTSLEGNFYFR